MCPDKNTGMWTYVTLPHETLGEEAGQNAPETGGCFHDVCPQYCSSRSRARFSRSGRAERYQYVLPIST